MNSKHFMNHPMQLPALVGTVAFVILLEVWMVASATWMATFFVLATIAAMAIGICWLFGTVAGDDGDEEE
jgi:hypothetical protein